ncbi:MAG: hypothetical protein IKA71_04800, partial [Lentisphaeria bacterium]|nr:hypothetical protein [Lentisphaeria bacterium]
MSFSINDEIVGSWSELLSDEIIDSTIAVSGETVSGKVYSETTPPVTGNSNSWNIDGSLFDKNYSSKGAAAALRFNSANNTVSGSTFTGNTAAGFHGGAVAVDSASSLIISDSDFIGNEVSGSNKHGGALSNSGMVTISGSTFAGNKSVDATGGAIYNQGILVLNDVLFDSNQSKGNAGALRNNGGTVSLAGVTFANNTSSDAAFLNNKNVYITGSVIFDTDQKLNNSGTITIETENFIKNDTLQAVKVISAKTSGWYSGDDSIVATNGANYYFSDMVTQNGVDFRGLYVTNADEAVDFILGSSGTSVKNATDSKTGKTYVAVGFADKAWDFVRYYGKNILLQGATVTQSTLGKVSEYITGLDNSVFSITSGDRAMFLYSDGKSTFNNVSFVGNTGSTGAAIYVGRHGNGAYDLTLQGTTFANNVSSDVGGAIYLYIGSLTIDGSKFSGNTAEKGGGAINVATSRTAVISKTLFENNYSNNHGGAISTTGIVNISESIFRGNSTSITSGSGGAIYVGGGTANISDTWFENNYVNGQNYHGGAICTNGIVNISESVFRGNSTSITQSGSGGAIYVGGGTANISDTWFDQNTAHNGKGGAIRNNGATLYLSGVTFSNNKGTNNIAVLNSGNLYIYGKIESGASQYWENSGTITVQGENFITGDSLQIATVIDAADDFSSWMTNNGALTATGGKLYSTGQDLMITNADAVVANTAAYGAAYTSLADANPKGKVLILEGFTHANAAHITLSASEIVGQDDTLISGNTDSSGGVFISYGRTATFDNLTFANNIATSAGGVFYIRNDGATTTTPTDSNITIKNSRFVNNGAVIEGGTTYMYGGVVYMQHNSVLNLINCEFDGNYTRTRTDYKTGDRGGAIFASDTSTLNLTDSKFLTSTDTIQSGYINLAGAITFNASVTATKALTVSGAEITFGNEKNISISAMTFADDTVNTMTFNGSAQVKFTVAGGQSLSSANITVNGALFDNQAVTIATGIKDIGTVTVTNNADDKLEAVLVGTDLVLKAKATISDGAVIDKNFINEGSESLITGGEIKAVFVGTDLTSGDVDTEVRGGKFSKFFVGGALVKTEAADMGTV